MYKLSFYVPESHLETVKTAVFTAGAGRYQNYDQCSWQTLGQGQFRPLTGSRPFLGSQDELEKVVEYKVEMVCEKQYIKPVLQALLDTHPYEEPAYAVTPVLTLDEL